MRISSSKIFQIAPCFMRLLFWYAKVIDSLHDYLSWLRLLILLLITDDWDQALRSGQALPATIVE